MLRDITRIFKAWKGLKSTGIKYILQWLSGQNPVSLARQEKPSPPLQFPPSSGSLLFKPDLQIPSGLFTPHSLAEFVLSTWFSFTWFTFICVSRVHRGTKSSRNPLALSPHSCIPREGSVALLCDCIVFCIPFYKSTFPPYW